MNRNDTSMEYDTTFVKRPKERKNYLTSRVNKFQEIVNQSSTSPSVYQAE